MTWQVKPVGEVFRVVNGGTPKTGVPAFWEGPHQWITPAEMGSLRTPYLAKSRRTLSDAGLQAAELVPANSIILSSRAPIGHLVINEVPMAFNQGCKGLVPISGIETKYAYYFFLANVPLLESLGIGATFKELSGGKLKDVAFRFPHLKEQHRIVAILDEAFAGIATAKANAEKNLQNKQAVFEAHLQSEFSGRSEAKSKKPLGELADFRNGINFTKASKGTQVRVLGVKDFQNHFYAPDMGLDRVTIDGKLDASDSLQGGDIVFVRSNGNPELIGRSLVIEAMSEETAHSGFTIRARLRGDEVMPNYLGHFLKSSAIRKQMVDGGVGTNIKSLNQGTLSRVVVQYPSRAEQEKIVKRLEAVCDEKNKLESIYTRKLAALDELKQSLLQQAFSGQL